MTEKEKKFSEVASQEKATTVAEWLREKQGADIIGFDLRGQTPATDYMILVSAKNTRHAQALADSLLKNCGEHKLETLGMEGYKNGQWVLVDLNDVIVHVFHRDVRGFYNLEGLWAQAPVAFSFSGEEGGDDDSRYVSQPIDHRLDDDQDEDDS